ncbi:MAG: alpha/beta fold hydrolase [Myxococcota bacterium]
MHHGLVGSSDLGPMWSDAAEELGVRLLAAARPGYGHSDAVDMNAIGDWAGLLQPVLDHHGWTRFATVGISAGAPYAYALAARLGSRVSRVAIVSGLPAVHKPDVLALYPKDARAAFARYAAASRREVAAEMRTVLEALRHQFAADDPVQAAFDASLVQDVAGPGREAWLQMRPWGFSLRAVRCPVRMFQAEDDTMVPFRAVVATARRLPEAQIIARCTGGHRLDESVVRAALTFVAEA